MIRLTLHERILAAALAALAGFVDATGFIALGRYFVSFMSGNSTRLAVGLAQHSIEAGYAASLIGVFVAGVALGSLTGHAARRHRRPFVLVLVSALLALAGVAALADHPWIAGWMMALAMGAENAVFEEAGDIRVGLTYMTGTLVKVGQRVAAALRGGDRFGWAPWLLQWAGLVLGALIGAALYPVLNLNSLWLASGWAALLAVYAADRARPAA